MTGKQMREKQLMFYGRKVNGLSAYINFWSIFFVIISGLRCLTSIINYNGDNFSLIVNIFFAGLSLMACLTVRGLDKFAFYSNLVFIAFIFLVFVALQVVDGINYIVQSVAYNSSAIASAAEANYINLATNSIMGIANSYIAFGVFFTAILFSVFTVYYFIMFIKHRKLFLTDVRILKKEYESAL
ncbi:MAG: hypothetical protein RR902_00760 [Oscillospiraceae bacterium]